MKKKSKKNIPKLEILLNKIDVQKAYGIKLPIRQSEYQKYVNFNKQLVEKKILSKEFTDKCNKEQLARTLDDDTYKLFYECLLEEKNRELFNGRFLLRSK